MRRSRSRKIALVVAGIVLLVVALIAALPVWFPWALGPAGRWFGLTFKSYDRVGYSRFVATSVVFSNRNVVVKGDRVEAPVPTVLLWELWFGDGLPPAVVENWSVTVGRRHEAGRRRGPPSTRVIVNRVDKVFVHLRRWLPSAVVTNGIVETPHVTLKIPNATFGGGVLSSSVVDPKTEFSATVRARVQSTGIRSASIASASHGVTSRFERKDDADTLKVAAMVEWLTNTIYLTAEFDRSGVLPDQARLSAEPFIVPADILRLEPYEALRGRLVASWQEGRFQIECSTIAQPKMNGGTPPLRFELHARADTNAAVVESASLTSSAITAELSEPVFIRYKAPFISESILLKASADLSQQHWLTATGKIDARALVFPSVSKLPAVNFQLSGSGLQLSNLPAANVDVSAELRWPALRVSTATVQIPEQASAEASAEIDLEAGSIVDGSITIKSVKGELWAPKDLSISNMLLSLTLRGPFRNLNHDGRLTVDSVVTRATKPARVVADWHASHLTFTNFNLIAEANESRLSVNLAAELAPTRSVIRIEDLTMVTNKHEALKLAAPATLTISPDKNNLSAISVSPLHLAGGAAALRLEGMVQWPGYGFVTNTVENLGSSLLQDFLRVSWPPTHVQHWQLGTAWSNGPAAFAVETETRVLLTNGPVIANVRSAGTDAGVALQSFSIASERGTAVTGEGFLPLTIDPIRGVKLHDERSLNFRFSTVPDAAIWNELAARVGVRLEDPTVNVLLGGSWKEPQGEITAAIERITWLKRTRPPATNSKPVIPADTWPSMSNARLAADVNRDRITVKQAHIEVEGQPLDATAEMPLGDQFWDTVVSRKTAFDWQAVTARVVMPQTELQPFAAFLPELLAPQGRFHLDLTLSRGDVAGVFRVQDLRTRPLPGIGPVRDLDIRARFEGKEVALHPIDARIGGRQVRGEGTVRLPTGLRLTNALPEFNFHLWGANVPLARQADAVIRADLELELTNAPSMRAPQIIGGIRLRNSYFLSDLEDLVPGKVAGPKRRPPYFSITNERFADWRLAVSVRGDEFLKIRSPLFRGVASATLRLEGTLLEPSALGEVRINSGRILFPFATLQVDQGFVTLTSDDPYRPHLMVVASTRRVGYEIKVEVTGPADEPIVQFSSTPPLSPEQIVLMLTAGQMPSETARLTTEQRAQRMALFVGGNLLHEFGVSGANEERLSVRTGEQLTETGTQTYEVEYKLTDDLSLVGEYDRFNEFNVGLKWRIYSR